VTRYVQLIVETQYQRPCRRGTSIPTVASFFNRADTNRLKAIPVRTRDVGFEVEFTILGAFRKFRLINIGNFAWAVLPQNEATIKLQAQDFKCMIRNKD
jgi:hypothetical protein